MKQIKTVQLVGKITGLPEKVYKAKFHSAEKKLELQGYRVINPVSLCRPMEEQYKERGIEPRWEDYMAICLKSIAEVDAICLLPDTMLSKGAKEELETALALGKFVGCLNWYVKGAAA